MTRKINQLLVCRKNMLSRGFMHLPKVPGAKQKTSLVKILLETKLSSLLPLKPLFFPPCSALWFLKWFTVNCFVWILGEKPGRQIFECLHLCQKDSAIWIEFQHSWTIGKAPFPPNSTGKTKQHVKLGVQLSYSVWKLGLCQSWLLSGINLIKHETLYLVLLSVADKFNSWLSIYT